MNTKSIRNLAAAVMLQAVKDFVQGSAKKQSAILKDLRSNWMDFLTDGMSIVVAEQLEKNPDEIKQRMKKEEELE